MDGYGDVFVLGSNEQGQLGLEGELHARTFKKLNTDYIGKVRRAVCIADATFLITREEELYFTGRISHARTPLPTQASPSSGSGRASSPATSAPSPRWQAPPANTTSPLRRASSTTGTWTPQ